MLDPETKSALNQTGSVVVTVLVSVPFLGTSVSDSFLRIRILDFFPPIRIRIQASKNNFFKATKILGEIFVFNSKSR